MRLIVGMDVKKAMQNPIPISHPGPVLTTKQVSQLLLGVVGTLCFKIMIFSPFHKECGGRSPFHKECGGRSPKSATFETMRMLMGKEG